MHKFTLLILLGMLMPFNSGKAQKEIIDANIIGHVESKGEHLAFASVAIKGTTIGTVTDETGRYQLNNLKPGQHVLIASMMGYKPIEKTIAVSKNETLEFKIELEEDQLNLEEVVVSADRGAMKRTEAPVIVNTLSPGIFSSTQSVALGEALNFSPGLRLENNCLNCGFSQVRMNGLEGPYSQILINSRPIFSGLAGVYGLELLPANMIEKVEIVRGGGSALYGSNAIAGTINIILKEPVRNSYQVSTSYTLLGTAIGGSGAAPPDYTINANTSLVSDDRKTGITLYGSNRKREMFDANGDGFSELAPMDNLTMGTRFYHRFGSRDKLSFDLFSINEERDGGNMQDYPLHERDIAESVAHNMKVGGAVYERYFREYDLLTLYASGQFLTRDSYYGAEQSLKDYGISKDRTYNIGLQYKVLFGKSSLVMGVENNKGSLTDKKLGYPDFANAKLVGDSILDIPHTENTLVADQSSVTSGVFAQYDLRMEKLSVSLGARYDHYSIYDYTKEGEDPKTGSVVSPRLSIMYALFQDLQARISYSSGYRAPQIFDEDLHIETSGLRQVLHENDPNLVQESSQSFSASLDYNGLLGQLFTGILVEGFYTRLDNAFVNEMGEPDALGRVTVIRTNASAGAIVQGVNLELKLKPAQKFMLTSGFTFQTSEYEEAQDFGEKRFFRSPNQYGYLALDWDFIENLCLSVSGNYTGKMRVPYYGVNIANPELGELRISDDFYDIGVKVEYEIQLNGAKLTLTGGIKNMLNAYQADFDSGIDRDPAYIYGPYTPRSIYFGIAIGNF